MSQIDNNLLVNLRNQVYALSPELGKVGSFIADNPEYVMRHSITELAITLDTSIASVTRFCRAVGLHGFVELRTALAITLGQGREAMRQEALRQKTGGAEEVCAVIDSIQDSNAILDEQQLVAAADWLHQLKMVSVYAAGAAVPVGLFLQINLMRMGKIAHFADRYYQPANTPLLAAQQSGVIAVHTAETSADMLQALTHAHSCGMQVLSITRGTFTTLRKLSDWNLQAAVAVSGQPEHGFSQIAGSMMVADRLLQALERLDERYSELLRANQPGIFSIESVLKKLSEYFLN